MHRGSVTFATTSTSCADTLRKTARCCAAAATPTLPVPGDTLQLAALSSTVHAPPTSAVPQPPDTVRPKLSEATGTPAELTVKLAALVPVPFGVVTEI